MPWPCCEAWLQDDEQYCNEQDALGLVRMRAPGRGAQGDRANSAPWVGSLCTSPSSFWGEPVAPRDLHFSLAPVALKLLGRASRPPPETFIFLALVALKLLGESQSPPVQHMEKT